MAEPSVFPVDPGDADAWHAWANSELAPLDLSVSLLHQAAEAGQRRMDATSPLAPKFIHGTDRWSGTVVALRELTGWQIDESGNLPRTVHPSGGFFVVVMTGTNGVGLFGPAPTPKNGLGKILCDRIDELPTTIPLFNYDGGPVAYDSYDEPEPWIFLTSHHDGVIHSELSQPSMRDGDEIVAYTKRIQLPPFEIQEPLEDFGNGFDDGPDDAQGPDIDVQPLL